MSYKKVVGLALLLLMSAAPARPTDGPAPAQGKDTCLLYHDNCPDRKDDIYQRIARLRREIAKGPAVYTPEELRTLQQMLDEYEQLLDRLLYHNTD
ncbi:hypothetical protein RW64_06870 [Geobacter sulfurreducens]|nr:hypothetical protein RW64_06870 [Geobacter sulfurreducens]